ncbi:MAG: UTP--glucose-1-phosphate uridylyltransferase, partial [Apilactobacillus kunkeei]|nr:UTP--glucose-1-phosphate uridylyltransferase [Apilactobacillus kunkeei]
MKKIKKAIIPAAGLGTRFLPETKAMPKEMLPVVDKPAIQLIVEEAIASGITDILIIIGKGKRAIEDHFDSNTELELNLESKGKDEMLKAVKETNGLNIYFKRQEHPNGLGDAVHTAKSFVGEDPFVIMLGDDLMTDETPLTKQLIDSYEETGSSTLAVMKVPHEDTSKYGVINPAKEVSDGLYDVTNFVEKPNPEDAPSDLAIIGRYLLTADIFDIL